MIQNTLYEGRHVYRSQHGVIERAVPALVSPEVATRARAQLSTNRTLSRHEGQRYYLLRGLVTCADCGATYVGSAKSQRNARTTGAARNSPRIALIRGTVAGARPCRLTG